MAFAHAVAAVFFFWIQTVAAVFDIDLMAPLVSFAECLGASRLMDACSWFIDLWKGKHETGQWLEIEAAEAMSNRSDFSAMNASGIMLSSMANKQNESVIDKTVVMLECEKPSFPIVHPSQENMGVQKERYDNHDNLEKTDVISEYAAIRAPASPMEGVDIEPIQSQLQEQPRVYEVTTSYAEKEPPNSSSMYSAEKPYLAPLARLSSLENACTDNSEYGKAPSTNLETAAMGLETAKAQVSGFENLKLEKIPEVLEKPQAKVSPEGFRRTPLHH